VGEQPHLLGDIVADPPEVDDIAAAAQLWRRLDKQRLVTGFLQPVGQRRTGDASSIDGNLHGWFPLLFRASSSIVRVVRHILEKARATSKWNISRKSTARRSSINTYLRQSRAQVR
jgi:hypothetical protein